jgi:hypothetical protein
MVSTGVRLWFTIDVPLGQEDFDRLRSLSYAETHIVMLCFSASFAHVCVTPLILILYEGRQPFFTGQRRVKGKDQAVGTLDPLTLTPSSG